MKYKLFFLFINLSIVGFAQIPQIIYFTDAHQLYELDDVDGGRGGLARLKTIVDNAKKENKDLLTIHGGDFVGGVLYGGIFHGKNMIPAFNQIPVDVFNFGQHEFDYGVDNLLELMKKSKGEFFTSNLIDSNGNPFANLPKFLIKKINGQKFLFIGLTDQMETTKKDDRSTQADLFESVELVLNQVKSSKVDYVVAVTQMDLNKNKELITRFPVINVVLTEELEEYNTQIHYQGNIPIIATAGNMSSVVKVSFLNINQIQIENIALNQSIPYDKKLRKIELREKNAVDELLQENLADLKVDLNAFESLEQESLAGNLITDAMKAKYNVDLAIIDGSGIRNNVDKGNFTLQKVRTLLPYGNKMVVVKIKGKDFKDFIYSYLSNSNPKLVQISGASYQWSPVKKELKIKNIDDYQIYSLILNDYNFGKLKNYEEVIISADSPASVEDYTVLKDYIKIKKNINPILENRININDE